MRKLWSTLVVLVAMVCFVAVSVAAAQDKDKGKGAKGRRFDPAARWAALAKGADKEGATELTKDEFVQGVKAAGGRMADQGEAIFDRIKKADEKKITKDEFVSFWKEMAAKRGEKKPGERKPKDK